MADSTVPLIKARLEAILTSLPEIETVITDRNCNLTMDSAPAVEVRVGPARRVRDTEYQRVTRTFEIWFFAAAICGTGAVDEFNAQEATYALLDVIPDAFLHRPRLELEEYGEPLDGVNRVGLPSDNGVTSASYRDNPQRFTFVQYRLEVEV